MKYRGVRVHSEDRLTGIAALFDISKTHHRIAATKFLTDRHKNKIKTIPLTLNIVVFRFS